MKAALVTGASGYLGGHVARHLLAQGWQVVALTRLGSRLPQDLESRVLRADYDGTLQSIETAFARAPVDVVVHLASAVISVHAADQLDGILDANVRLPTQLLEVMRAGACKRFVNTGTFWQHCNSDHYSPVNLYAATKQAFEDVARAYVENEGISLCTLVLFDTYGTDDRRRKIVRLLVESIDGPEPLPMSPGGQVLDLTHAQDVAAAFVVACERLLRSADGAAERFCVSGERMSLKELVALVQRVAGRAPSVRLGALPYREREIMKPIASMPLLPGWAPERGLDDEIATMLARQPGSA